MIETSAMERTTSTPIGRSSDVAGPIVPVLSLVSVSKQFDGQMAVHPATLDIAAGEFVTLLGPSGCGKTTLLRMIAGLERPSAGRILADGVDVTGLRPEHRPFNMVFQNYALFPHLNVFDNVAYGPRAAGIVEGVISTKVKAALTMVGLEHYALKPVDQLSGGMSQRVALVRAIINEPKILLLDEPLAALDLQLRKRMQVELRSIQQRIGTTFIHVTHDQEEALVMSDRIVVMKAGQIVQVGSPHDVYHRPRTQFVAQFVGETSLLHCVVERVSDCSVDVRLTSGLRHPFSYFGQDPISRNQSGFVSLRPQHLVITRAGKGMLEGTISNVIFMGAATDYVVALDGGGSVRVQVNASGLSVGQLVGVDIMVDCGTFVSKDDGDPAAPEVT
jgi:spermidine/putrescine transport system ATP-binding protein